LRILKDGHWRADDEESERAAWEESVRLREQMFWCRIGGGVVPAHHSHTDAVRSPRVSEEQRKEQERKLSEELERTREFQPRDITPVPEPSPVDVSNSSTTVKRTSKASAKADTAEELWKAAQEDAAVPSPVEKAIEVVDAPEGLVMEKRDTTRDSTQSSSSLQVASGAEVEKDEPKRLSITIPGSFE
jgi:hypothetical protein